MKRSKNHERANRKAAQRSPASARLSATSPAIPAVVLSARRKWLFRFLAAAVLPAVLLCGLELALRLSGFGFDTHFFKREGIGGKDFYIANNDFGFRFFPRGLARIPTPVVMPGIKAPDTVRVFIFGESAALGDPRQNYGAGCYLQVLLAERFPRTKFEVINTAITAINSHAILPIAKECASHEGDVWLIYMGNNEMVGPFGAATAFGWRAPPLWLVRTQLQLQRLRVGQLLVGLGQKFRNANSTSPGWRGMEMFVQNQIAPDDPRKLRVYRSFEKNLDDILKAGLSSGARVVLSTVPVNLKDCPPFGTLRAEALSASERDEYAELYHDGVAAGAHGQFAHARADFERAIEISPSAAEAQFGLADCLLRQTNASMAAPHFVKALDSDTLPFRADSKINEIIRKATHNFSSESLVLCDAVESLKAANPDGIPGEESFYEHVHLNPTGNYALAIAWVGQVEKMLKPEVKRDARPSWVSQNECDQLLGLTDWNRVSIIDEIVRRLQRPPFIGQAGNTQQRARLQNEMEQLRQHLTNEVVAAQAREIYARALRRAPENYRLHENYAEFLEVTHDLKSAVAERKKVCELLPGYYFAYYTLGVDLKEAGNLAEARETLLKAVELNPREGDVRLELGIVYARDGKWDLARQQLEFARRFNPGDAQVLLYLGEVLWKLGRRGEALTVLRDAVRLAPSDWQPHYRLAGDLAQQGSFADAAAEYQEVLRLNPANIKAKLGLAGAFANTGRQLEASRQLDEILMIDPNNPQAFELRRKIPDR